MHVSARSDYAVRAVLELALTEPGRNVSGEALATAQGTPPRYTTQMMVELRRAGIVTSQRGADGGFRLARPAEEITIADVIRAIDGPLAEVRGMPPEQATYDGAAVHLQDVWIALRTAIRGVLETTTIADVAAGRLPPEVRALAAEPTSWSTRQTRPGVSPPPSSGPPRRLR